MPHRQIPLGISLVAVGELAEFARDGLRDSNFTKESWQEVFQPCLDECGQRGGVADDDHGCAGSWVLGHERLIASRSWSASSAL